MADLLDKDPVDAEEVDNEDVLYIVVDPNNNPMDKRIILGQLGNAILMKAEVSEKQITANSYTLQLSDQGRKLRFMSGDPVTLTVPENGTVGFPIGTEIQLFQDGVGQVTVDSSNAVTINAYQDNQRLIGQFASATLQKAGPNE